MVLGWSSQLVPACAASGLVGSCSRCLSEGTKLCTRLAVLDRDARLLNRAGFTETTPPEPRNPQLENSFNLIRKFKIWTREREGQDLIEPALLAGFVVVAAGAIVPGFANDIREILVKIPGMMPWTVTPGSLK